MTSRRRIDFSTIPEEINPFPWDEVLLQDEYWMDRYGEKHLISEMDTDYIRNCIPFALFAVQQVTNAIWSLLMTVNGEMAQWSLERELGRYEEAPLLYALQRELDEREHA